MSESRIPNFGPRAVTAAKDSVTIAQSNTALSNVAKGIMSGLKIAADGVKSFEQRLRESGLGQGTLTEAQPAFNAGGAEGARFADGGIKGSHNTFIILGRDRPGSKWSGKGSTPATHCGAIDIIAGLSGRLAREAETIGGPAVVSNKSPEFDGARIYLTQNATNIDSKEYFNLAQGKGAPPITDKSAIVLKADLMRIVGREGVKIVTGDVYSSGMGLFIQNKVKGIDLIAGNNSADLQPLVKGEDLKAVIKSQLQLTKNLHSSVSTLYSLVVFMMLSFIDPSGFSQNRLEAAMEELPQEFINLWIQELNFVIHELNYDKTKNPFAWNDFLSGYNHTN